MSPVTRSILLDGSELWHTGKLEDVVFDDSPVNIFPTNVDYAKKRRKDWSGTEWLQAELDADWEKDRPADSKWSMRDRGVE